MTALPTDIERLALLRWRLYPASRRSKAACIKDPGASATFDLDKLQAWTREFPDCNWRMVCEGSGVWALDVDVPSEDHAADGVAALADLVKRHGPIPTRPMTRSGGGGLALFFRHRGEPIHGATGWPVPGIDPRRGKLSVTVPPSIHVRTRRPYRLGCGPVEGFAARCTGVVARSRSAPARRRGLFRMASTMPIRCAAAVTPKPRCVMRSDGLPAPHKASATIC